MEEATEAPSTTADYAIDALVVLGLFVMTAFTIYPFFSGDFTQNWGSIESAFISDALYIANNYPHLGWYPYWYGGLPFYLSYPPLLPSLVAAVHSLLGWSIFHSYRVLTGLGYSAVPVAIYVMSRFFYRSKTIGLIAGASYALIPTFLGGLGPSHIDVLALYGEGPHTFALPFVLFATVSLLRCFKKPNGFNYLITSLLIAVVALTNLIGLFALGLFAIVALFTEIFHVPHTIRTLAICAALSYGFVAFQYDLDFIRASAVYAGVVGSSTSGFSLSDLLQLSFLFVPLTLGALVIARENVSKTLGEGVFFTLLTVILFGVIVLPKQLFNVTLAPQPIRYVPELDIGLSLLVGLLVVLLIQFISGLIAETPRARFGMRAFLTVIFLLALVLNANATFLPVAAKETAPSTQISDRPEFQISNWLAMHVRDERVYATGTIAFWLDVFSNVGQIRGGSDQGATNIWWNNVTTEMNTGHDTQLSILWAQAWNVKYIVIIFPNASTPYHDYIYPNKFNGVLPMRYYYEGFGVYEVPLPQPSLVEAVSVLSAKSLTPISNIGDRKNLQAYVNFIASSTSTGKVTYFSSQPDQYLISVSNATPDTEIVVKMTFDPRWKATIDGQGVPISSIGPDFMAIYPEKTGSYQVNLGFDRSTNLTLGYSIGVILLVLVIVVPSIITRTKKPGLATRPSAKRGI